MAKNNNSKADKVRNLYNLSNNWTRKQWEFVNQRGHDFAHDEQLSKEEREGLEEQGMPTFTINRILPVVEMLNFYATAKDPRWQAIGAEGSDSAVAAVISDLSDYIWGNSNGQTLYTNAINDAITKGIGYLLVSVDPDADNGLGEVVIKQPEPFDVYIDPKSRDIHFKDAAYILIRKVLPKNHLVKLFPGSKKKIFNANSDENISKSWSQKSMGTRDQKLFSYNDNTEQSGHGITADGEMDDLVEFFEVYEKVKVEYINLFFRIPPDPATLKQIKQQSQVMLKEMEQEMTVQLMESQKQMQEAVQAGQMLPERFELEMQKAQKMMQDQLQAYEQETMSKLQAEASVIENKIISKKEFNYLMKNEFFKQNVVDTIPFFGTRIRQSCIAGDKVLYEKVLPEQITEYPLVPFHYKWTGTPYPISAVAPLVGKQQEINKAHQIMVHNASLGSSLRWMYEEGSIDSETWEKYSSSPGALLPVRPGVERPSPVMPAPLSNAFFQIVQAGKSDMEYLAGIYSSMMGDSGQGHETYKGMLALDEYGTRRIKQWMGSSIEPSLKSLGQLVMQFSQATYTAYKKFRIVQPNALQEGKESEINIPMYNDMGEAIGKSMNIQEIKYDVRIVAGSTLPVNRWAYLAELKELMQMGVVDDIAVLAETDIKNKDNIAKRKSMYSQMQGQIQGQEETLKDLEGTIETLERQLVQAGIKGKVDQASIEINKKKEEIKAKMGASLTQTEAEQKLLRGTMQGGAENMKNAAKLELDKRMQQDEFERKKSLQDFKNSLEKKKDK